MRYIIARFRREIPNIVGMSSITAFDNYQIFSLTDEAWDNFPENIYREEITELEGTVAWKFYGEVRGYRSAYSDVEGLEPDPDELAKGKRKTKIYFTPEIEAATILLMKRFFKRNVLDIFAEREDQTGKEDIISMIDSLSSIKEICYKKEELLGVEMSKTQLRELFCWDEETDSRIGKMVFKEGF